MKFESEALRMQHPLAEKIPPMLWSDYFEENELPDFMIPVMEADDASLEPILNYTIPYLTNRTQKGAAWIAMMCSRSHASLPYNEAYRFAILVGLSISDVFILSAGLGRLDYLLEIKTTYDILRAYRYAAANGHLEVLKHLESRVSDDEVQKMIEWLGYCAYRRAAAYGHFEVLKHLESKVPDNDAPKMVMAAYRDAALYGRFDVLQYLESKVHGRVQEMILADDYVLYRLVAEGGRVDVLKYLESKVPDKILEMMEAGDYEAYRKAALYGHFEVLKYLESRVSDNDVQKMIEAKNYEAYRMAAKNGQVDVLKHLESKVPGKVQEMIEAGDYEAYRGAAANGHLEVLKHLESRVSDNDVQKMIEARKYGAYQKAALHGHFDVCHHLFARSSACFAYAEMHIESYGHIAYPFIQSVLLKLHQEDMQKPANTVFDIDDLRAELCFYFARHLMRHGDKSYSDEIRFLLSIPAVRALAQTSVNGGESNELLRLATRFGGEVIRTQSLIREIEMVQKLALQSPASVSNLSIFARGPGSGPNAPLNPAKPG